MFSDQLQFSLAVKDMLLSRAIYTRVNMYSQQESLHDELRTVCAAKLNGSVNVYLW